jgi:hypothetical protein
MNSKFCTEVFQEEMIGPGIAYHLLHEAEGGGLARDPDVACGCLRRGHGACTARVGRGLRRRRYGWVGGGVARTEEREETLRMRGGGALNRCVLPGDSGSGWWGLTHRRCDVQSCLGFESALVGLVYVVYVVGLSTAQQ